MASLRQRLNLTAPTGEQLFLTQLSTGASLTAEGTMTMTLPTLKQVSGDQTIDNVANKIITNTNDLITESTNRQNDDATLQSNIDAQKAHIDAILNLSTAELDTFKEIADAYTAADSNLQTLITNLTTDFNALKAVVDALATNTESSGV